MCVVATAVWCRLSDSNRRPTAYKAVALPTELSRRAAFFASNDAEGPALDAGERVGQRGGGPGRRLARDRAQPCGGQDRKSVVEGKSVSVRYDLGGRRTIKKKKNKT